MIDLKNCYQKIVESIGTENWHLDLEKTPERASRSFEKLTSGYREDIDKITKKALFKSLHGGLVLVRDIEFYSLCEHHLMPFFGKCHVGYLPDQTVIGLSKIPRIVNHFSRKLQMQENLTYEIAHYIHTLLNPRGVGVVIEGSHLCMMMRGVEKQGASMQTRSFFGVFEDVNTPHRSEFLKSIAVR